VTARVTTAANVAIVGAVALCLAAVGSMGLLIVFAGAGENRVHLENGRRVAEYGLPLRFAQSNFEGDSVFDYRVGEEATFNPWEIKTTFDRRNMRLNLLIYFVALVLPFVIAGARRPLRARLRRPSARPS
jgi:hypothetical protein